MSQDLKSWWAATENILNMENGAQTIKENE